MANAQAKAIARLNLKFQLDPQKYVVMTFSRVNPGSDLAAIGHRIASVTQFRDYPCQITTNVG